MTPPIRAIDGIAELHQFGEGRPRLLIEVPHGATERGDYDALARRLTSRLPARLHEFFHVNTDFGAPELASRTATLVAGAAPGSPKPAVVVLRARVPRTFIDFNREIGAAARPGMTPGLPPYITTAADRALLGRIHREYAALTGELYDEVCGAGGIAVALHTFAPKSVEVTVDADIVGALRDAYRRGSYSRWKLRPAVDLITADDTGADLSPRALVADLAERYAALGLDARRNATYHLHPATMAYRFAARYPGQVLCVELRRDLLGSPWRPFMPSPVGPRKVLRLAQPLAAALKSALARPR